MSLLLSRRASFPHAGYFNGSACGQTMRESDRVRFSREYMKLGVTAPRWTYSAACAGFRIACNGSTVEPSEISAKANRFCFRTDRMNPLTLISLSSKLQGPSALLAWRTCAHRREAIRECGVELEPSLATDVAKVRRHVYMAESRALRWEDG
jgi:hypothetical protein